MGFNTGKHIGGGFGFNSNKGIATPSNPLTSDCSYFFDAVNNKVGLGSHINTTIEGSATFSIRIVFRLANLTANRWIFANGNSTNKQSLRFQWFQSMSQIRVWFYSDGSTSNVIEFDVNISNTNWHEIIITYNAGTVTLYQDGSSATYTVITGSIPTSLYATGLAPNLGVNGFDSSWFNGYINQFQIASDIITSGEASDLWNGGSPLISGSSIDNVVADYLFDNDTFGGTNWTVIDRTGGGNGLTSGISAIDRDCNENPY